MKRIPLWSVVLANGLAGMLAIAALIVVLINENRLTHIERTVTVIHRQVTELIVRVKGVRPNGIEKKLPPGLLGAVSGLPVGRPDTISTTEWRMIADAR